MATDDILSIQTDERVRTLTLNRPQSRNASSAALRDQFFAALAEAETDDAVDVMIVTGSDPVFCAGIDRKVLGGQTALPDISPRWPPLSKPVIGAINGAAVTGGLEVALYCDILIASEHARFADTHARVGLLPTGILRAVAAESRRGAGASDEHDRRLPVRPGRATGGAGHRSGAARAAAVRRARGRGKHRRQQPERGPGAAGSYHRIDSSHTGEGLWLEATAAREFRTSGDDIAANREAVLQRGRAQVR